MKWLTLAPALLLSLTLCAQKPASKPNHYAQIDALALKLPDSSSATVAGIAAYVNAHFTTPTEKTRAIFIWIADKIDYDVVNMFALNFYDDPTEDIARPLRTRKGICVNYASLFTAICNEVGIQSVVVQGYTKERGFVGYIPHAWSAAVVDGSWYLFDPTWGSGYVENNVFVRKINEAYFKATPETFIATHMPFDPLWEFLYYPVTTEDFFNGRTGVDKTRPYFNYEDSIKAYDAENTVTREAIAANRIERNGVRNSATADMIRHLRVDVENHERQAESDRQNRVIDSFNLASRTFNQAITLFNAFIDYRNDQFKPAKPDAAIQQMLDSADRALFAAKAQVSAIVPTVADTKIQQPLQQLTAAIAQAEPHFREAQEWLTKYFSKGKLGRKSMFYKFSWL
ncbi:MAG TPA: transglutaminase domain-containing protein [Puia sp.]|nr:transglutaminase domain-containing protein [Puia sp.]